MKKNHYTNQITSSFPLPLLSEMEPNMGTDITSKIFPLPARVSSNNLLQDIVKELKLLAEQATFGDQKVGIPTFDGYVFSTASDIIRCEGLQKCTRIFFAQQKCIVSSYNIGCFEKLLSPFNFFVCHKSHMINLNSISKYSKSGVLHMSDGSQVPVSRRKRKQFIEQFAHI